MKNRHQNANLRSKLTKQQKKNEIDFFFFRCQKHFESIRLFLSHYGFCSLDSMYHLMNGKQWDDSDRLQPKIQLLDSSIPTFMDDIKKLDKISPTLYCTGQIFYLKRNQCTINESLSNTVGFFFSIG